MYAAPATSNAVAEPSDARVANDDRAWCRDALAKLGQEAVRSADGP